MSLIGVNRVLIYIFSTLVILACMPAPVFAGPSREETAPPVETHDRPQVSGGLVEEIRGLTETGILSSMLQAIELIRSRDLSTAEFGRMMTGINVLLIRLVYPDSPARLPEIDLPQTYNYTRIIRESERGNYLRPSENSTDFFEHILPFLAVPSHIEAATAVNIFRDLEKAGELSAASVLPAYFRGVLYERLHQFEQADEAFRQVLVISAECYPAQTGIARIKRLTGHAQEAAQILNDLMTRYPDSREIKRQLAITLFELHETTRAMPMIDEILQAEPRNGDFILMRASILIEQGQFTQANTALDNYASINPNNRSYLFMRARVQAEGNRNRESALNYLRSIFRTNPDDEAALILAVTLLMESQREADLTEGRQLLERLQRISGSSVDVLSLSIRDAVSRESWQQAQGFLNRILAVRRSDQDLNDGYQIERGLGNNARALTFARELYERDNTNNEYAVIYAASLIDNGRRDEASRLLESRFNSAGSSALRSRYYYLRSRLQSNEDSALSDLRSSLFEDPRNLDALIAMFEIYHRRREERRAVHYLRQALAIAPDHPVLRRYEREYASLLGRN